MANLITGFFGWLFSNAVPEASKGDSGAIAVVAVVAVIAVIFGIVCSI